VIEQEDKIGYCSHDNNESFEFFKALGKKLEMESVIARVLKDPKQSENGSWFEVLGSGVEGG